MSSLMLAILGTLLAGFVVFICFSDTGKYKAITDSIDPNEYLAKDMFFIGFRVMSLLDMDISSEIMQKKIRNLSELFGSKEAKKIALYDMGAEITYGLMFTPIGILMAVIMDNPVIALFGILLSVLLIVYVEYDKVSKLNKRRSQINRDFPHMLSQMALLINAGMPLRETLSLTAAKQSGIIGDELKVCVDQMENGIPDYEALSGFADRCGTESVRKFSSIVTQNVKKGSTELADALLNLSGEVWRNRISMVRVEGEKTSTKLLIPILIIFAGILLMVIVPMFSNMTMSF